MLLIPALVSANVSKGSIQTVVTHSCSGAGAGTLPTGLSAVGNTPTATSSHPYTHQCLLLTDPHVHASYRILAPCQQQDGTKDMPQTTHASHNRNTMYTSQVPSQLRQLQPTQLLVFKRRCHSRQLLAHLLQLLRGPRASPSCCQLR